MTEKMSARLKRTILIDLAACALAAGALMSDDSAFAQHFSAVPERGYTHAGVTNVAELERAFWACDYAATIRGVHATPIEMWAFATDELKRVKFGGSFDALLAWWRINKDAEHRTLDASGLLRVPD